jgi:hypothetical protein
VENARVVITAIERRENERIQVFLLRIRITTSTLGSSAEGAKITSCSWNNSYFKLLF